MFVGVKCYTNEFFFDYNLFYCHECVRLGV